MFERSEFLLPSERVKAEAVKKIDGGVLFSVPFLDEQKRDKAIGRSLKPKRYCRTERLFFQKILISAFFGSFLGRARKGHNRAEKRR